MIVISNATPLRYLIEIEKAHILKELFGTVVIPQAVFDELRHKNTPQQVREWIQAPPEWLEIRQTNAPLFTPRKYIGKGEHETIALALELNADAVLIDDRGARQEAMKANLFIIPTLAVLERAAKKQLIDLPEAIDRLSKQASTPSRNFMNNRWNATGKEKKPRDRKNNHKKRSGASGKER